MKIALVDIGGTTIKSGLLTQGVLGEVRETPTHAAQGGPAVMERVMEVLVQLGEFEAIGCSTAGQVDSVKGLIRYANPNIPHYTGTPVRQILSQRFGVPVAVENDVNAAALGEAAFGAGKEAPGGDFLCLTYGTGVGGAIVMGGKIYTGSSFSAGEFGCTITHGEDRVPTDPMSGCYERYASTTALVAMAQELDPALASGRLIFARMEEPAVREVVERWVGEIALGLTSLVHIFNPALVVLGGGVMEQEYVLERLRKRLSQSIMPSYRGVELRRAALGNRAGLLGAGSLAQGLLP